jgi:TIR domain
VADRRVFISHSSSERELAQSLKQRLEADFLGMLDIFVSSDRCTIQAGSKWLDDADRGLHDVDIQLVLCSTQPIGRR